MFSFQVNEFVEESVKRYRDYCSADNYEAHKRWIDILMWTLVSTSLACEDDCGFDNLADWTISDIYIDM